MTQFLERGWARFGYDPALAAWADAARRAALTRMEDPLHRAEWLQCGGTWFVGVDTLPNDASGAVGDGGPLSGPAYDMARALYGNLPLHQAQVSIVYPGYPRPRDGESDSAFGYRKRRDAAHVDGLLAVGVTRARILKERHAYILGMPLTDSSADASPLVVWEGSHEIMRAAFDAALADVPHDRWGEVDLTEVYTNARRVVFDRCARVTLPAKVGEATLIHRLALHGVAPWSEEAEAPSEGRMIAYFRPEFLGGGAHWLLAP